MESALVDCKLELIGRGSKSIRRKTIYPKF